MADYDVVIRDARVVDGVNKEYVGDVGVKNGRVLDTGNLNGDAERLSLIHI